MKKFFDSKEWNIVSLAVIAVIVLIFLVYAFNGYSEASTRINIRLTARIAGIIFSLAFAASSLHYFFRSQLTAWLLSNRKYIGISFALIFLLHLVVLVLLQVYFHPVFRIAKTSSLIGGGMAYAFTMLMFVTSFPVFRRPLSNRQWIILHTVGGYWIWFIFIKSYWKRAATTWEFIPLFIWFAVILVLRICYAYKK